MPHEPLTLTQKLIRDHLKTGKLFVGHEIGIAVDQILLQDATGTLVMLALEAMELDRVQVQTAVQYVDHNLLQTDYKNADDHEFLRTAAQRFGFWFSRPGNGVSHPVHMERFGRPGLTLLGSDSHTCAAGALGMLAIGTGGVDTALAAAGDLYYFKMPKTLGVKLKNKLRSWVSAKDVILEMLRRYNVNGCRGMIIEYYGDGVRNLSVWDRHVIANMGAELGATTSVFPSDEETKRFLTAQARAQDWCALQADTQAVYDQTDEIDLAGVESLIAKPSSPGNVVTVRSMAGMPVHQCVIGSSANPGLRDFWIAGQMLKDRSVHPQVSLDVNPTSRQILSALTATDAFTGLLRAGGRIHQTGCMGCIGMGQAPATGKISLRTVPRNFPGRSGTVDDQVYLCSPETAAASAVTGVITEPASWADSVRLGYPVFTPPSQEWIQEDMLIAPAGEALEVQIIKGPNIKSFPVLEPPGQSYEVPVLLKLGDHISTDEILQAGAEALPYRSNIPEISKWCYQRIDPEFHSKAQAAMQKYGGHVIVAGENYAQGSSREHAALAPRYLGQIAVLAKSYARIGWQNLINYCILPLEFVSPDDYDNCHVEDRIAFSGLTDKLRNHAEITVKNLSNHKTITLKHSLSRRQIDIVLSGGVINYFKQRRAHKSGKSAYVSAAKGESI